MGGHGEMKITEQSQFPQISGPPSVVAGIGEPRPCAIAGSPVARRSSLPQLGSRKALRT
jgi:hypothetical protein